MLSDSAELCRLEKGGPRSRKDVDLISHELCSLPYPPRKEQTPPSSAADMDLFGADWTKLSYLQSPAETKTLAGGKDGRVSVKTAVSAEGWDVTQVAPPLALIDGFIRIQAAVFPWVSCVP